MALSVLTPAFERSKKLAIQKSSSAILKLVPELRPTPGQQATDRLFYSMVSAILALGLLGLLGINILLGNDAVKVRELKIAAIKVNEEREEALRKVALLSTSEALAERAISLGMIPSSSPTFLDISEPIPLEPEKVAKAKP
ncbi:MAG: hypothetical protein EB074_03725 [Actinobacteria bacterium]|nr:hypothetical protein [Actinomycetota bacterium]NCV16681.1 hypothetical protein [Actinomycetota bacterium]NCZ72472.1 hypothetical protein [Actinomycetota bacterium]NDE26746.1 hypothetical protein [Actinomycetota bacterium]NDE36531.1 hypothetical protein [Actinomycetota bacterium]